MSDSTTTDLQNQVVLMVIPGGPLGDECTGKQILLLLSAFFATAGLPDLAEALSEADGISDDARGGIMVAMRAMGRTGKKSLEVNTDEKDVRLKITLAMDLTMLVGTDWASGSAVRMGIYCNREAATAFTRTFEAMACEVMQPTGPTETTAPSPESLN